MIRTIIESIARNWLYERKLVVRSGKVPLLVSPSAGLRYLFRRMESVDPHLIAQAEEFVREGDIIWDVGANVGLFSFAAASWRAGRGAFGPSSRTAARARPAAVRTASAEFVCKGDGRPAAVAGENAIRSFAMQSAPDHRVT